jgi:hypothetical protein
MLLRVLELTPWSTALYEKLIGGRSQSEVSIERLVQDRHAHDILTVAPVLRCTTATA